MLAPKKKEMKLSEIYVKRSANLVAIKFSGTRRLCNAMM